MQSSALSVFHGERAVLGLAVRAPQAARHRHAARCVPAARPAFANGEAKPSEQGSSRRPQSASVARRQAGMLGLLGVGLGLPEAARAGAEGYQSFSYDGRAVKTLPLTGAPVAPETKDEAPAATIELTQTFEDEEVGYQINLPKGWVTEIPSLYKREFHAPGDYKGKRVTIEVEPLGKLQEPTFNLIAPPLEYAETITDGIRKMNQGATGTVLSANERDGGRIYFYEYRINSLEPQLVWGAAGVGLGQNESARKFRLRQRVLVTCKVAESGVKQADKELFKQIIASFKFVD